MRSSLVASASADHRILVDSVKDGEDLQSMGDRHEQVPSSKPVFVYLYMRILLSNVTFALLPFSLLWKEKSCLKDQESRSRFILQQF